MKDLDIMTLDEANKRWYELRPIEGVRFGLNDAVCIKLGDYSGDYGSVISLESLDPVAYVVELPDGVDLVIAESALERADNA